MLKDLKGLENQRRYLRAPTLDEIDLVLETLGVTMKHFERFFNIYPNCIAQLRMKERANVYNEEYDKSYERKLPKKYWHIIFENLPGKHKEVVLRQIGKPKLVSKQNIQRTKKSKVVMDDKIRALI